MRFDTKHEDFMQKIVLEAPAMVADDGEEEEEQEDDDVTPTKANPGKAGNSSNPRDSESSLESEGGSSSRDSDSSRMRIFKKRSSKTSSSKKSNTSPEKPNGSPEKSSIFANLGAIRRPSLASAVSPKTSAIFSGAAIDSFIRGVSDFVDKATLAQSKDNGAKGGNTSATEGPKTNEKAAEKAVENKPFEAEPLVVVFDSIVHYRAFDQEQPTVVKWHTDSLFPMGVKPKIDFIKIDGNPSLNDARVRTGDDQWVKWLFRIIPTKATLKLNPNNVLTSMHFYRCLHCGNPAAEMYYQLVIGNWKEDTRTLAQLEKAVENFKNLKADPKIDKQKYILVGQILCNSRTGNCIEAVKTTIGHLLETLREEIVKEYGERPQRYIDAETKFNNMVNGGEGLVALARPPYPF